MSEPITAAEPTFEPSVFEDALESFARRVPLPTVLDTRRITERLGKALHRRAFVSATVNDARHIEWWKDAIGRMLEGRANAGELRVEFKNLYPDSVLAGYARANLLINTNLATSRGYGQTLQGNDPDVVEAFPAWELVKGGVRTHHRGDPHYKEGTDGAAGWQERFGDAIEACSDTEIDKQAARDVLESGRMIALKSSDVWQALGDGAGGREDTLGNPFPPFAWESSYDFNEVTYEECVELGILDGGDVPEPAKTPSVNDAFEINPGVEDEEILSGLTRNLGATVNASKAGKLTLKGVR